MIAFLKRVTIGNIVSPYGLAMMSYLLFLFAWLFPPGLYTWYIGEPDLMFLDPKTFVYFSSCVAAFLMGVRFTGLWDVKRRDPSIPAISNEFPLLYLILPIAVTTV